jgi:hypothetical protein
MTTPSGAVTSWAWVRPSVASAESRKRGKVTGRLAGDERGDGVEDRRPTAQSSDQRSVRGLWMLVRLQDPL